MLLQLLGIEDRPLAIFAALTVGGLLAYFAFSGLSYLAFFVWGRRRFHPGYVPTPSDDRAARGLAVASTLGNAVLTMPLHFLLSHGYGKIYWNVDDHGWPWLFASMAAYLALTETLIYWIHRALHGERLYRLLHRHHHRFRVTNSWVSTAFHPLDSFSQALPHHLAAFLFPVHGLVYLGMVALVTTWAVVIHDRVSWVRWKLINYTGHHTLHHWYASYNFGQYTTIWDRLMGTYRDPEVADPEIPEGVVVRWQDERAQLVAPAAPTARG